MTGSAGRRRSPLEGFAFPVGLREVPFLVQVNLRVGPADAGVAARLASALGFALPSEPNTVAGDDEHYALWLGPDEWLVTSPEGMAPELRARLTRALAGRHASVVDLSASRAVIEVTGRRARDLLAKGCGLDLHPRAFGPGCCAQTLFAKLPVIIDQLSAAPAYRLFVRRSIVRQFTGALRNLAGRLDRGDALAAR